MMGGRNLLFTGSSDEPDFAVCRVSCAGEVVLLLSEIHRWIAGRYIDRCEGSCEGNANVELGILMSCK